MSAAAALLRAEYRKLVSTRTWWGLLVPVVALGLLTGLFAGVFTLAVGADVTQDDVLPLVLAALAYTLTLTALFAGVHGVVLVTAEFRHRTITTTYLTAPGRGHVLVAKVLTAAVVGVGYAVAATVGVLLGGLAGRGLAGMPTFGALVSVVAAGVVVAAAAGAVGAALGVIVPNQVGALLLLVGYAAFGEPLLSLALDQAESRAVAGLTAYLPVNLGEVTVYGPAVVGVLGPGAADAVDVLAGVIDPLSSGASALLLVAWALALGLVAWWAGGRRDIT